MDGGQRVVQRLVDLCREPVEVRGLPMRQKLANAEAGLREVAGSSEGLRQVKVVLLIPRIERGGGFEKRDRLSISGGQEIEFAEPVVCFGVSWSCLLYTSRCV